MTPERFFMMALPRLILARLGVFANLEGKIAFVVADVGTWTIRFGNLEEPVVAALDADAGLMLRFSKAAFEHFLSATIDIAECLRRGTLEVQGDLRVMQSLGTLFRGAESAMRVRIAMA